MKTYTLMHICIKSDNELMHRVENDYRCGICKMALAAQKTDTHIYAYAFMSTHVHMVIQTFDCKKFISIYRSAYTRWFNHKYHRKGRLGNRTYHKETLETLNKTLRAINYVLRNPVHHLVSDTAMGYEFCSARYIFSNDLSAKETASKKRRSGYCAKNAKLPASFRLNDNNMIAPDSFLEISAVESLYMTAKNYLYLINRPSYKDIEANTYDEDKPLTLNIIEQSSDIEELQKNERQRSTKDFVKDIDLCEIIDNEYLHGRSYTQIGAQEKATIVTELQHRFKHTLNAKQINRCLAN